MIPPGDNRCTGRTACPTSNLSNINPTWNAIVLKLCLHDDKVANNCLSTTITYVHTYVIHTYIHSAYIHILYIYTHTHTYTSTLIYTYLPIYIIHTHIILTSKYHTMIFKANIKVLLQTVIFQLGGCKVII